jgi:hypothetical protein
MGLPWQANTFQVRIWLSLLILEPDRERTQSVCWPVPSDEAARH